MGLAGGVRGRGICGPERGIWGGMGRSCGAGQREGSLLSTFTCFCRSLVSRRETGHWAMSSPKFDIFLIFPYFLRSYVRQRVC